jgi:hypothetical protein
VTISTAKNSTKGVLYLLRMDADGFLRLYSHNMDQNGTWSVTWFSEFDKCVPKGLCGFNAYCVKLKMVLAATVFLDLHLLTTTKLLQAVQGISP